MTISQYLITTDQRYRAGIASGPGYPLQVLAESCGLSATTATADRPNANKDFH